MVMPVFLTSVSVCLCVSLCISACLRFSVCVCVCVSVCVSVYPSTCMSVSVSVWSMTVRLIPLSCMHGQQATMIGEDVEGADDAMAGMHASTPTNYLKIINERDNSANPNNTTIAIIAIQLATGVMV